MEISVAMWKKFLPIFVRIVVEREDVVGVPYIDDEASGDKTEVFRSFLSLTLAFTRLRVYTL